MQPFTLTTERLTLDVPAQTDAPLIHQHCQDPDFERYLTIPWPYRMADAEYFVNDHVPAGWANNQELTWALRLATDGLVGIVGLRVKAERYDIGFWLGAEHRGHGYMPEAVRAVVDWAFGARFQGLGEVTWECIAGNAASAAVARKLGFTYAGEWPSTLPARDGSHPPSWHATLSIGDDRSVKLGWPGVSENEGESA